MIKRKNVLENIITAALPFATFLLLVLSNFVSFGFQKPSENWWWQLAINAVAMLGFWLPARQYATQRAMESERIKEIERLYIGQVQKIYDNDEVAEFREYLKVLYNKKVDEFINKRLKLAGISRDEFENKYKNNNKAVDKSELTGVQKKLIKKANSFRFIKQLSAEAVLPNIIKENDYIILDISYEKKARRVTARKLFLCLVMGAALAMIAVSVDYSMPAMSIITSLAIRFATGIFNFLNGLSTGKNLININYAKDIASKTLLLQEFQGGKKA